jgi:hypothetical protein
LRLRLASFLAGVTFHSQFEAEFFEFVEVLWLEGIHHEAENISDMEREFLHPFVSLEVVSAYYARSMFLQ